MILTYALFGLMTTVCGAARLAHLCESSVPPGVVCVSHHAAVLQPPFSRDDGDTTSTDDFADTITSATSFDLVRNATFTAFDHRAFEVLGKAPAFDIMFTTAPGKIQEAPVYVPYLDAIIFSILSPDEHSQRIIEMNWTTPRLSNYHPSPAVWGVNGARYHNGLIYWAVVGEGEFQDQNNETVRQAPGIYTLDPKTQKTRPLLNNYYGSKLNGPDDVVIDKNGDIFFTDPWFGWAMGYTFEPVLQPATWRFRPSTGAATIVDNTVAQPNGLGISPDGRTLYVTDGGVTIESGNVTGIVFTTTNQHCTYAFTLNDAPSGQWLSDKRPIWCTQAAGHDGFHVAANGFLVGAAGEAVDVLSGAGELLVRIETNFTVNNVQFAGRELDELWLFGQGSIARVQWDLKGMEGGLS